MLDTKKKQVFCIHNNNLANEKNGGIRVFTRRWQTSRCGEGGGEHESRQGIYILEYYIWMEMSHICCSSSKWIKKFFFLSSFFIFGFFSSCFACVPLARFFFASASLAWSYADYISYYSHAWFGASFCLVSALQAIVLLQHTEFWSMYDNNIRII